ncbi:hypothetical protein K443DRAFT_681671 [Laccaria amethystina LaAM-08-1]|uniref:Uncharacterized protein n=1 Tax=Laccaria amethystina LaAM-08-1 TaxID=1095629 RepID=A0A0C9XHQ4_9AGAR|nr:hypothetical protein K443DRAFT_681671 [Laccaria amethystina LaAM-08-1]
MKRSNDHHLRRPDPRLPGWWRSRGEIKPSVMDANCSATSELPVRDGGVGRERNDWHEKCVRDGGGPLGMTGRCTYGKEGT